jgi:fibronectin type 3 domain-containing protein
MLRHRRSRRAMSADNRPTTRRLGLEDLESRHLLSATGISPDYVEIPAASSGSSGYTPAQIRAAYGFSSTSFGSTAANGSGQTIAIIDAYNDPNIASNLATFDQAMGIAAPASLKIVSQTGSSSLPGTDPSQGWEGETALDVEWAHAIAPGANILLVEANSSSDSDLFAAVNYARQQAGVSVISMSWGSNDSLSDQATDQSLSSQYLVTPAGHQGITFVASSGDHGVPSFPAESPNVLAVGGTDLHLTSSGSISSETAWLPTTSDGSVWSGGGGVSQEFPGRKVPDVAYNAGVGMAVYDTFGPDQGWVSIGGTSAGAPQWAALVAIADQGRALAGESTLNGASQTLAAIYAAPAADFHDITSGSTQFQSAGTGYDLATGLGSPVANLLIPYLAAYGGSSGTTGGTTSSAPAAPTSFTGNAISSTQVSLSWATSSGATSYDLYEFENGKAVQINSFAAGTTSATVSGLAAGTTYDFNLVAVNSAGAAATPWIAVATPAATVSAVVSAPANFQAVATSSTTAQLSWSASPGATGYRVYEWNGSQAVQVASLGASTTSTTISGLSAGATSYFYVSAYNSVSSAPTNWVSVKTLAAITVLSAPANVMATATSTTTATVSWSAATGATAYQIYYWNGSQGVMIGSVGSGTTSVTISGLSPGTTSYFAIVATNGTSQAASGWASVSTPLFSAAHLADVLFAQTATQSQARNWLL